MKPKTIFSIDPNEVRYAEYHYQEGWDTESSHLEEHHKVWVVFIDGSNQNIFFESEEDSIEFIDWLQNNLMRKTKKREGRES